jgi:hypothetical protein
MCFGELAHQSKACDGSAACAFFAFVLVIDGRAAMLARVDEVRIWRTGRLD